MAWAPSGENFRGAGDTDWNAITTSTSRTITRLTGGSDYKVKVRARFSTNPKSGWRSVATATAKEAEAPPPPVIVPPEPEPTPDHAEGHGSTQHFVLSQDSLTIPEGTSRSFTIALD